MADPVNALSQPLPDYTPQSYGGSNALAAAPPLQNFMAAMAALKLTPEEQALYMRHLTNLYGQGGLDNPDGSRSSLSQINTEIGGRAYNIPSIYDGQRLEPDPAIDRAIASGINQFPSYPSSFAAENRYQKMHNYMDQDTGNYFADRQRR